MMAPYVDPIHNRRRRSACPLGYIDTQSINGDIYSTQRINCHMGADGMGQ
jgi:hypothetical protein